MKYAFKCKNCGALEPAGNAGEREKPRACHVCGAGVKYSVNESGTGVTQADDPGNWIVLADATDKELKASGLAAKDVEVHKGKLAAGPAKGPGKKVNRTAGESVGAEDEQ